MVELVDDVRVCLQERPVRAVAIVPNISFILELLEQLSSARVLFFHYSLVAISFLCEHFLLVYTVTSHTLMLYYFLTTSYMRMSSSLIANVRQHRGYVNVASQHVGLPPVQL